MSFHHCYDSQTIEVFVGGVDCHAPNATRRVCTELERILPWSYMPKLFHLNQGKHFFFLECDTLAEAYDTISRLNGIVFDGCQWTADFSRRQQDSFFQSFGCVPDRDENIYKEIERERAQAKERRREAEYRLQSKDRFSISDYPTERGRACREDYNLPPRLQGKVSSSYYTPPPAEQCPREDEGLKAFLNWQASPRGASSSSSQPHYDRDPGYRNTRCASAIHRVSKPPAGAPPLPSMHPLDTQAPEGFYFGPHNFAQGKACLFCGLNPPQSYACATNLKRL